MKNKVIEKILPLTAEFEGFRSKVYKCPAGFDTIGYGRNIEANPLSPEERKLLNSNGSVSEEVAKVWLKEHLEKCYNELDRAFSWFKTLDEARQCALVDLCFNMGLGTLKTFKNTLKAFENKDFIKATEGLENSRWFKQVGRRGVRISRIVQLGVV